MTGAQRAVRERSPPTSTSTALVEEILWGQSTRSPPSISGEPSGGAVASMWLFGLGWLIQAVECPWQQFAYE